jgi:hypothetical protein
LYLDTGLLFDKTEYIYYQYDYYYNYVKLCTYKMHMACMRELRNAYKIVAGKPEGRKPEE